jgi:hypothetical protein
VTGTATITSFGTVAAGTLRIIEFTGALTLTHNATSLKLPGNANITTAVGDIALLVSLGSGNWKCLNFSKADGSPVAGAFNGTLTSTDAGAGRAPDFIADRNSASPAANDQIGSLTLRGRSSTGVVRDFARLRGIILDAVNATEDGQAIISAMIAGTETDVLKVGPGVQIGSPAGGDKGAGTLNLTDLYIGGNIALQAALFQDQKADGTAGGGSTAGSEQTRVLNTTVFNSITGCSLASNTITLATPGTYVFVFGGIGFSQDLRHRMLNNSDSIVVGYGLLSDAGATGLGHFNGGAGVATIAATKDFRLQYRVGTARATDGLGQATSWSGEPEVYSFVLVIKVR